MAELKEQLEAKKEISQNFSGDVFIIYSSSPFSILYSFRFGFKTQFNSFLSFNLVFEFHSFSCRLSWRLR